ncbi:MAG: tetratricopeptide repeat protein [Verrucomicrobiota bacterium]
MLPLLAAITLACVYLLVHESKKAAREASSPDLSPVRSTEAQPRLEPAVLLKKLEEAEGLENRGDFAAAEAAFASITGTNPESDRGWGGYGRALLAEKKYREAAAVLDQACRLNVVQARHFAARGAALRAVNDLKHAIRDYRDALTLDPGNTFTSNTLLFVALEMGDTTLFERTLEKIRQSNPGSEARWVLALAVSEMRAGNSKEAGELISKASEILPQDQCRTLLSDRIFADKRSQDLIQAAARNVSP